MGLLNPMWLWGLLGLGVPVIIHLLSRKDLRVIRIGSLRHLQDGTTRQAIRIHLHNYLLLALRCLIVVAAALLLAGLYFNEKPKHLRWILVEGDLAEEDQWRGIIDSLENDGYELRRLQTGFPLVAGSLSSQTVPDYWKLAENLARVQLDRCVVISRSRQTGFAGLRPFQDARVSWLTATNDSSRFTLASRQVSRDSARIRLGNSNGRSASFETTLSAARVTSPPLAAPQILLTPLRVVVSGTNIDAEEKRVVMAALRAVQTQGMVTLDIRESTPAEIGEGDWLIWLSSDAPPATAIKGAIVKKPAQQSDNTSLWLGADMFTREISQEPRTASPFERLWTLTGPITMQNAVREHLTLQLANILLSDWNEALIKASSSRDERQIPELQMFAFGAAKSNITHTVPIRRASAHWVAILLMSLLVAERWIANRQQL